MRTMLAFVSAISLAGCVSSPTAYSPPAIAAESTSLQNVLGDANSVGASTGLTPADIAAIAVLSNPDLKALRARAGVADAQIFAAGLLPDPTVSLGVDIPTNGVGVVTALAGSIGADLSAASSRNARMEAARANARGMRQDILWAEWLTRQNAYLLANRISYLEQIRAKTSRLRQLANEDLSRVLKAAGRGDVSAVEVDARRLGAADAADRDRSAENQLAAARLDLKRLLGIGPDQVVMLARLPEQDFDGPLPSVQTLFELATDNRADVAGLREGLYAANAGVAIADASRFPLPSISINAARDTGDIGSIGPAVSFSLPLWNRARGNVVVSKADLKRLEAEYLARLETVRADIGSAMSAYNISKRQYADVVSELSGIAHQADATEAAAARGDIAESAAAATRMTNLDKEILADTLALAAAEAAIALETSVGLPLDSIE